MQDLKLVAKAVCYKNKQGKEIKTHNFFVVLPNGRYVQVKPAFNDGYATLRVIADYEE